MVAKIKGFEILRLDEKTQFLNKINKMKRLIE